MGQITLGNRRNHILYQKKNYLKIQSVSQMHMDAQQNYTVQQKEKELKCLVQRKQQTLTMPMNFSYC
eukprot:6111036-Ditylum_brightwellii.AAC.1